MPDPRDRGTLARSRQAGERQLHLQVLSYPCRGQVDSLAYVDFCADIIERIEKAGFEVNSDLYCLLDHDFASVYVCNKRVRGHVGKSSSISPPG